jgi:DNA polymerase-3 subunit delta
MSATTLVGNNSFLIEQYISDRVEQFNLEHSQWGIERINVSDIECSEIISKISSVSIFSDTRLLILYDIAQNNQFIDCLDELLVNLNNNELIIVEPKLDGRSKLYKKLQASTNFKQLNQLSFPALINWIMEYVKSKQGTISRSDAEYLIGRIGLNQLLCYQELNKLIIYNPHIDQVSIDLLVIAQPKSTIFDLVKFAFNHNHKRVNYLYQELRTNGEDSSKIIGLLAWQLHLLATIKTASTKSISNIASDLGANPKTISETKNIAQSISFSELRQIIYRLLDIDDKSKRQAINIDDALLYFLLSF